jgi:hypothetical protein
MPALTRSIRGSSNQLLHHVLEEPTLVAAVRELPAPALVRLIHHVGLEDAGELIALTTAQQLSQVFDAELWQSAEPGSDETFRPERFALFLHLLYEAGESFVVQRLLALPRELLTLAVHKLLLVVDIDALTVRFNSSGRYFDDGMDRVASAIDNALFEEWEEFRLIARDANAFDDLWNALLALDCEDHELVRYVIERCCDMDGELIEESGLYAVLNEEELLENDIASERSERRAAAGFVAPADARAFLELARRETIDESADGRDPIARAYFRELAAEPAQPERAARVLPAKTSGAPADVGRLLAVLRDANVLDDGPAVAAPARLAEGRPAARRRKAAARADVVATDAAEPAQRRLTLMAAALLALRERDAALHAQRTEEVGFLANVLMAGSQHDGRAYRAVEAIEAALAACSVGIELECARRGEGAAKRRKAAPSVELAASVVSEWSADRLFRAGFYALRTQVVEPTRAALARALGVKLSDVRAALHGGSVALISELGIAPDAGIALAALAEDEPWTAGALAARDRLFIASHEDIRTALAFLATHELS